MCMEVKDVHVSIRQPKWKALALISCFRIFDPPYICTVIFPPRILKNGEVVQPPIDHYPWRFGKIWS